MIDKSKDTAKEWFFLYERGKLVGREEYEEKIINLEKERDLLKDENAKLRAENDRIKNVVRVHAERMADAGYSFEAEGLLEDVNRKGAIER